MKKLNKFNKTNKKKNLIIVGAFLLTGLFLVGISYAVYQKEDEVRFINAKVGSFETSSSDIELAMTLDGEDIAAPPSKDDGDYIITVECDYADGSWDKERWGANIDNISSNRVKCNVSFNTPKPTISEITATSKKTSVELSYTSEGINVGTICKYGIEEEKYSNEVEATNISCNIKELEVDTLYYYEVCAKNGGGEACQKGSIKTRPLIDIGDYIKMIPTATSYTIPSSLTGYSSDQKINPSELNIWRVIKKNEDGTIEAISEYVSSNIIWVYGERGYLNIVGILNTIAAQYTDGVHVERTRHFGYRDQIEWCSSLSSCPTDTAHQKDKKLINDAGLGMTAPIVSSLNEDYFWPCWREIDYAPEGNYYRARMYKYYNNTGANTIVLYNNGTTDRKNTGGRIRPIITLKSGIQIVSGDGGSEKTAYNLD